VLDPLERAEEDATVQQRLFGCLSFFGFFHHLPMPAQWFAVGNNVFDQVPCGESVLVEPRLLALCPEETIFAASTSQIVTAVVRSG
jgi:hypothetical protein